MNAKSMELAGEWFGPLPGEVTPESKEELASMQAKGKGVLSRIRECLDFANARPKRGESREARQEHAAKMLNKISTELETAAKHNHPPKPKALAVVTQIPAPEQPQKLIACSSVIEGDFDVVEPSTPTVTNLWSNQDA